MAKLVFLHGYSENHHLWDEVKQELKSVHPRWDIYTPDLPGFGKMKDEPIFGLDQQAEYILNDLKLRNIEQFVLFGHSMGAYIGLEMYKQQGKRFKGFGFIHSNPHADSEAKSQARAKAIQFIQKNGLPKYLNQFAPTLVSQAHQKDPILMDKIETMLNANSQAGIINALKSMAARKDHTETLRSMSIPVLLVAGRHDQIYPVESSLTDATISKETHLEIIDQAGHCGPLETPGELAKIIASFTSYVFQ